MLKEKRNKRKDNYALDAHKEELDSNDKVVIVKNDGDLVTLTLEPNKFSELSTKCRLDEDEFVEAIDELMEVESDDWSELRLKDMINGTRDNLIKHTILKYAKEEYSIDPSKYDGIGISFIQRLDTNGYVIGDQVVVTLSKI